MAGIQHILIVDDDKGIRDLLGRFLQEHGFTVHLAANGKQMQLLLAETKVDLIILDIMMPGEDGMSLCQKLRAQANTTPIIMLTAMSEDVDRIVGLEIGADDYINKPFNPRELLARVKAILRRSNQTSGQEQLATDRFVYRFSGWILDKVTRRLLSPDDLEISVSAGEYNLLQVMVERPQQILSRDQLLELTKNRSAGPFDRSVDIQISRLRQKIEEDHKNPQIIKTVRGGGYVLATTVERVIAANV